MWAIVVGAIGGAVVFGAVELYKQRNRQPKDWGKIGKAALVGGAFGAIGGGAMALTARFAAKSVAAGTMIGSASAPGVAVLQNAINDEGEEWVDHESSPAVRAAKRPPVVAASDGEQHLVLHPRPVGFWTDPVSGRRYATTRTYSDGTPTSPVGWPSLLLVPEPAAAPAIQSDLTRPIGRDEPAAPPSRGMTDALKGNGRWSGTIR